MGTWRDLGKGGCAVKTNLLFAARLEECYGSLTKSEKKVADFIREHMDLVSEMSAQKIAELTGTGPATVVCFCRSCGYSGLLELKTGLKRETVVLDRADDLEIQAEDSVSVIKQKILKYNSAVLDCVMNEWNETAIEQAVDAIGQVKRIVISGSGDSRIGAVMLHNNLSLQNKNTYHTMDQVEEQNLLVSLQKKRCVCWIYLYRALSIYGAEF